MITYTLARIGAQGSLDPRYAVFRSEPKPGELHNGVAVFSRAAGSDIYEQCVRLFGNGCEQYVRKIEEFLALDTEHLLEGLEPGKSADAFFAWMEKGA